MYASGAIMIQGNTFFQAPAVAGADNGLSIDAVSKNAVLGNDIGGIAATLLSNREIPSAGFDLRVSGAGNLVIGSAASIAGKLQVIGTANGVQQLTKLPAGQTMPNAFYRVTDSANTPIFEIRTLTAGNVFLGVGVGAATTTGSSNVAIGGTAFGATTFSANTSGNQNIAIGVRALQANTTGSGNVAVGDAALFSMTTGLSNIAVGQAALAFITTQSDNIGIGQNAGHGGGSNYSRSIMIGSTSYNQCTAGSDNVCVGYQTGATSGVPGAHGDGNVVIGSMALAGQVMGALNILIGFQNNTANVVGTQVICIGGNCNVTALNNVTAIGTAIGVTVPNVAVLGRADQNVLIGFTAAGADNGNRLQVNGSVSFSDAAAMLHAVVNMTDGAAASLGTLTNAPAVGDPTKWIPFDDNGTTRYIPAW